MRGEMLFFNDTKSFGFIRTEEGERLYVHRDGFLPGTPPEGRCAGKKVTFERLRPSKASRSKASTRTRPSASRCSKRPWAAAPGSADRVAFARRDSPLFS